MRRLLGLLLVLASAALWVTSAHAFKLGQPVNRGTLSIAASDGSALQVSQGSGDTAGWVTISGGRVVLNMTKGGGAGPYQFDPAGSNTVNKLIKVTNPAGAATRTVTVSITATSSTGGAAKGRYTPNPASFSLAGGTSQEIGIVIGAGTGTGTSTDTLTIIIQSQ